MSFIKSFTGSQQRADARAGAAQQRTDLKAGYDLAKPALKSGYANAQAKLQPFIESGGKANQLYTDTLGVNGVDARGDAQDLYMSDEVLAKLRKLDLEAQGRADNSTGRFNSGVGAQADAAVRLKNYSNWQDRLKAEGDKGGQFATQSASLDAQEGESEAGLEYGYGQQRAGITGQEATNVAGSRSIGINNLINAAGVAVAGFTPGKSGATPFGSMSKGVNDLMKYATG